MKDGLIKAIEIAEAQLKVTSTNADTLSSEIMHYNKGCYAVASAIEAELAKVEEVHGNKLQAVFEILWDAVNTPVLVILDAEGKETARCREIGEANIWLYHTAEGYQIFNDQQPCTRFNGVKYADLEEKSKPADEKSCACGPLGDCGVCTDEPRLKVGNNDKK